MKTDHSLKTLTLLRDKTMELLKREPKKSAIIAASAIAAAAVLSAEEGIGLGLGGWKTHELVDGNGPAGRSLVAATVETPDGWSVQGGVNWHNPNDATDPYKMSFTALSPDGKQRVEMHPAQSWASGPGAQGFARRGPAETAESVVRKLFVPKLRKGAQILKVERDAEAEAKLNNKMKSHFGTTAGPGTGRNARLEAVVATVEYQEGGERYQEQILSLMQSLEMSGDAQSRTMFQQMGGNYPQSSFNHSQIFTLRAPAGEMEEALPTLEKIANSLKQNDDWQAVVASYHRNKGNQHFRESSARLASSASAHQARMRDRQAAFDRSQQNYRDGQATNDASHRSWLNGHLGQADFNNPHTGHVETHTDHGGRMWQDSWGNTFGTENWEDDPRNSPNNWNRGIEEMNRIDY